MALYILYGDYKSKETSLNVFLSTVRKSGTTSIGLWYHWFLNPRGV